MYAQTDCERSTHGVKPLAPLARKVLGISLRLSNTFVAPPQQTLNPNSPGLSTDTQLGTTVSRHSLTIHHTLRGGFQKALDGKVAMQQFKG